MIMKPGDRCRLTRAFIEQVPRRKLKSTGTILRSNGECWVIKFDGQGPQTRPSSFYGGYVEPEANDVDQQLKEST